MDKKLGTIYITDDTTKFNFNDLNRKINTKNVKEIENSIDTIGGIQLPIIVDNNFTVIDGHHRIKAVIEYNKKHINRTSIPYMISDKDNIKVLTILNSTGRRYSTKDYIDLYAKIEDGQCRVLKERAEKYNIEAYSLLTIITHGSDVSRWRDKIKKDEYIGFDDWDKMDNFFKFVDKLNEDIRYTNQVMQILYIIYCLDNFNEDLFCRRIKSYRKREIGNKKLIFPASIRGAKAYFEEIFNKGNSSVWRLDYKNATGKFHFYNIKENKI